jgi:hypothetical protein
VLMPLFYFFGCIEILPFYLRLLWDGHCFHFMCSAGAWCMADRSFLWVLLIIDSNIYILNFLNHHVCFTTLLYPFLFRFACLIPVVTPSTICLNLYILLSCCMSTCWFNPHLYRLCIKVMYHFVLSTYEFSSIVQKRLRAPVRAPAATRGVSPS